MSAFLFRHPDRPAETEADLIALALQPSHHIEEGLTARSLFTLLEDHHEKCFFCRGATLIS